MNIEGTVLIVTPRRNKTLEYKKEKVFYASALEKRNDTLFVKTISENFSPVVKQFKSPADFLHAVTESMDQQKNIYDDLYTLSYRRIPRPATLLPR